MSLALPRDIFPEEGSVYPHLEGAAGFYHFSVKQLRSSISSNLTADRAAQIELAEDSQDVSADDVLTLADRYRKLDES